MTKEEQVQALQEFLKLANGKDLPPREAGPATVEFYRLNANDVSPKQMLYMIAWMLSEIEELRDSVAC